MIYRIRPIILRISPGSRFCQHIMFVRVAGNGSGPIKLHPRFMPPLSRRHIAPRAGNFVRRVSGLCAFIGYINPSRSAIIPFARSVTARRLRTITIHRPGTIVTGAAATGNFLILFFPLLEHLNDLRNSGRVRFEGVRINFFYSVLGFFICFDQFPRIFAPEN